MTEDYPPTANAEYAERLERLERTGLRRWVDVQAPYRRHIRRLRLGSTLDIGCGIGRNLAYLDDGVGVDHNRAAIEVARARGLTAFTIDEFAESEYATDARFDSFLVAHVMEHMSFEEDVAVMRGYLQYLKPDGRLCFITPQERGYASDETHVQFVDFERMARIAAEIGVRVVRQYSFPFPRVAGKAFTYNEFVTLARLPA